MGEVFELGARAREAGRKMAVASTKVKDEALAAMAQALLDRTGEVLTANAKDMEAAEAKGTAEGLLDRLMLNEARIVDMADGLHDIIALKDPVGEVIAGWKRPNGLLIERVRVPLGVLAVIYEARPNVTVECAGLAVKSGNALILRGGSLAINSCISLARIAAEAATGAGLPENAIQIVASTDRASAQELMRLDEYVDLLVPRGGPELIASVVENATAPVLWAGAGNCHVYIDASANLEMAKNIVINAKCQRPSVCNAAETLLVHKAVASEFVPSIIQDLEHRGVKIYGDEKVRDMRPEVEAATEADWRTEYLELKMAARVVDSVEQAIDHINTYGTMHSETIVTDDYASAEKFAAQVDSAAVYINASTRFTDGGQFGLGAEIGISTQKLHARGPMALEALTSTKYVIRGSGQIRS